jgi:hypothetical protein
MQGKERLMTLLLLTLMGNAVVIDPYDKDVIRVDRQYDDYISHNSGRNSIFWLLVVIIE